jgi:hypothetical protein
MAGVGSLHGFEIDCDQELRLAGPAAGRLGTVRVRATGGRPLDQRCELIHLIAGDDGVPSYALGRADGQLVSWHVDAGSFLIEPAVSLIEYRRADASIDAGPARWERRLGSTALPLLAAQSGRLPLHASAVAVDGGAVLICGVTGRGKSTLSAALVARGHAGIAEDGVVVGLGDDGPSVWPGLPGAMITREAAAAIGMSAAERAPADPRGRLHVEWPRTATGPTRVTAVAILMEREGDAVRLVKPESSKAHRELLAHVHSAERRGPAGFASAARLVETVPVALLVVPESVEELDRAAEALESLSALV